MRRVTVRGERDTGPERIGQEAKRKEEDRSKQAVECEARGNVKQQQQQQQQNSGPSILTTVYRTISPISSSQTTTFNSSLRLAETRRAVLCRTNQLQFITMFILDFVNASLLACGMWFVFIYFLDS